MYERFYQLRNDPFRLLPDPRVCFAHSSCAKAWAYLRYALKRGEGIVVVTGPSGSGKTTLAERLLSDLNPAQVVSARLIANDLNPTDLLRKLGYTFGLAVEGLDRAMLSHRIERYLIELEQSQRRALVLIDEAQTLSHQSLESMRLLTDMQSRSRPVFQLILLGQEGLEAVMSAPGMEQFQQRVIASCRLQTMTLEETKAYIEYRLECADWTGDPSVNGPAVKAIHDYSHGLPRHVNKICSRLLLLGSTEERHSLNERDVTAVVRDLRDELLAPLHGDTDRATEGSHGVFDPVHGLALRPSPRGRVAADASSPRPRSGHHLEDLPPVGEAASPAIPAAADSQSLMRVVPAGGVARSAHRRQKSPASATTERSGYLWHRAGLSRWPRPATAGLGIVAAVAVAILSWQLSGPTARALPAVAAVPKPLMDLDGTSTEGRRSVLNEDPGYLALPNAGGPDLGVTLQEWPAGTPVVEQTAPATAPATADTDVRRLSAISGLDDALEPMPALGDLAAVTRGVVDSITQQPDSLEILALATAPAIAETESATVVPASGASGADDGLQIAVGAPNLTRDPDEGSVSTPSDDRLSGPDRAPIRPDAVVTSAAVLGPGGAEEDLDIVSRPPVGPYPAVQSLLVDAASLPPAAKLDAGTANVTGAGVPVAAAPMEAFDEATLVETALVMDLLTLADRALAENRLLLPKDDNAYLYLQRVLEIQPDNLDAQAGMQQIAQRYATLARAALRTQAYERAALYVERGRRIVPDHLDIRAVDGEISQTLAAIEVAEAAEAAAAAAERERVMAASQANADLEPAEPKLSSLEMLMRDIDGL